MTDEPNREHREQGPARRLLRSRDDRLLGGVAGGLGRYFAIDPIIFRIGLAALAVFGGVGIFLYLAALLFVPAEGADGRAAGSSIAGRGRLATALGAVVLVIAGLVLLGDAFFFPGPLVLLAVVAIAVYALLRTEDGVRPSAGLVAARIGIGVGLLAASLVGLVLSAWASGMGYGAVVAVLVVLLGLGLVAGAVTRRREARWLVLPALVLAVPLAVVSAADIDLRGGFGERVVRPASAQELPPAYRLGAGELEIDLRGVPFSPGERRLEVGLGMGEAVVVVPRNVCVQTRATVGAGLARSLDSADGGTDVELAAAPPAPAGVPLLVVSGDVGMGQLQVVNDPRAARGHGRDRGDRAGGDGDGEGRAEGDGERGGNGDGPPWAEDDGPPWAENDGPPWAEGEDSTGTSGPPIPPQDNAACRPASAQSSGAGR